MAREEEEEERTYVERSIPAPVEQGDNVEACSENSLVRRFPLPFQW